MMSEKAIPKSAAGRKSKRTPETEAKIIIALKKGNTRRAACAFAGIGESTLNDWINEFPEFSAACTCAENNAEFGYVDVIQECANNGDWKAAAWWLERRRKTDYSSRQEVEHDFSKLTNEQLLAIVSAGGVVGAGEANSG